MYVTTQSSSAWLYTKFSRPGTWPWPWPWGLFWICIWLLYRGTSWVRWVCSPGEVDSKNWSEAGTHTHRQAERCALSGGHPHNWWGSSPLIFDVHSVEVHIWVKCQRGHYSPWWSVCCNWWNLARNSSGHLQYMMGCFLDLGITQVFIKLLTAGLLLRPTLYVRGTSDFAALSTAQKKYLCLLCRRSRMFHTDTLLFLPTVRCNMQVIIHAETLG